MGPCTPPGHGLAHIAFRSRAGLHTWRAGLPGLPCDPALPFAPFLPGTPGEPGGPGLQLHDPAELINIAMRSVIYQHVGTSSRVLSARRINVFIRVSSSSIHWCKLPHSDLDGFVERLLSRFLKSFTSLSTHK